MLTTQNPFIWQQHTIQCDFMKDIVFALPPSSTNDFFSYHLGAGYIRSYLKQHGIGTHQFATSRNMTIPELVTGILEYEPETVGFTCYDANYNYLRILARMLKKKDPHLRIVVGGPTATFSDHMIMEHTPEIDVCVRGEGEQTVLELVQKECADLESIQGITFRSGDELMSTPERPLIRGGKKGAELDSLPSPYLSGAIPPEKNVGILTSRGCIRRCTYCNFSLMFSHTIRFHSVDRVVKELMLIADHWTSVKGRRMFIINDDNFSSNLKRAKTLCQKIIDEGIRLPFFVEMRADNCDKELIGLMGDAGFQKVCFGLESASCKVLNAVKKPPGKEKQFLTQVKNCVAWAKEAGMITVVSVIFGLPGEGLKEAQKTLNFVKELDVDEYAHNILHIYAGTELFHTFTDYGLTMAHSPSFLPYITKYAYDVEQVPLLPNASLHRIIRTWKRIYCDMLSCGAGRNQNRFEYLIIKKMPHSTKEFCDWLREMCTLPLSAADFTENVTKEKGIRHRDSLIHGGVPLGPFFIVLRNGDPRLLRVTTAMDFYIPIPEIPFREYEKEKNALFTLEQPQDVETLIKFLKTHNIGGVLTVFPRDVDLCTLVGVCRWGKSLCPACSGGVLAVDGDTVLSCYHGKRVGKIGDSLKTLRENLQKRLREKENERGCCECPVKNNCSRCLFPQPLTDDEFCELRRKYPDVSMLVTMIGWMQTHKW